MTPPKFQYKTTTPEGVKKHRQYSIEYRVYYRGNYIGNTYKDKHPSLAGMWWRNDKSNVYCELREHAADDLLMNYFRNTFDRMTVSNNGLCRKDEKRFPDQDKVEMLGNGETKNYD